MKVCLACLTESGFYSPRFYSLTCYFNEALRHIDKTASDTIGKVPQHSEA
jgi:hypothetical protein